MCVCVCVCVCVICLSDSNAGGTAITSYVLQQWKEGTRREDIHLAEVERILAKAAINSESEGKCDNLVDIVWRKASVSLFVVFVEKLQFLFLLSLLMVDSTGHSTKRNWCHSVKD